MMSGFFGSRKVGLHLRPPSYARLNTLKTYTMREDNSCEHGSAFGLHNFSSWLEEKAEIRAGKS